MSASELYKYCVQLIFNDGRLQKLVDAKTQEAEANRKLAEAQLKVVQYEIQRLSR